MTDGRRPRKLRREAYWVIGAAIAFSGAIAARIIADYVPGYRVPIWLVGVVVILLGAGVLSLGTHAHLGDAGDDEKREDQG